MVDLIRDLLFHYRDLRHYLGSRLRNADDAADIAQTSFEQVYKHALGTRPDANPIESPRALLFRVAHNLCVDHARHRQIVQDWEDERANVGLFSAPSSEHVAAHRQLVEKVAAQLEQLPPRRRQVFLLFKAHGYTQTEIAIRLNITEAAVAKHVVRATLDCARVFAELSESLPVMTEPSGHLRTPAMLAEEFR